MNSKEKTMAVTVTLAMAAVMLVVARGDVTCSADTYADDDAYARSVSLAVYYAIRDTQANSMYRVARTEVDSAVARAVCLPDSSSDDCGACLRQAQQDIKDACGNSVGGRNQAGNCFLRYENYRFYD